MNKPLISILVPIFNVEEYLGQCLESLISQTLEDIEIICINDGSTDKSLNILKEYASKDNRIIVIDKHNTGYGNTMNIGLERAKGEYIGIVESDDFAEQEMFKSLYKVANDNQAEVVKSNYFAYKSTFGIEKKYIEMLEGCRYDCIFSTIDEKNIFFTAANIWTGIYKRSFLIENEIKFNETPGASYQDISFTFKILACAKRVYLMKDAFLNYRVDNMNSSVNSHGKIFCVCDEYHEIENFLEQNFAKKIELNAVKFAMKYIAYKWNYRRLASVFQYAFLMKMHEELKREYENGLFESMYWTDVESKDLQCVLNDPNKYFKETAKDYNDERLQLFSTLNVKLYTKGILDNINQYKNIIIFGAGIIGQKVAKSFMNNEKDIYCFAVSDINKNPKSVLGIRVHCIEELTSYIDRSVIVVAIKEKDQYEIIDKLRKLEFKNILSIDSFILNELSKEKI
ncbi:glycosyltransferase [Clostridium sp. BL-8]|uniref:glycosyltransferase n=1 Tax=Clostridium sp. BL-8 TaxID=349938 RepID=UPI00098C6DBE|nr:glycosyltransferase [Clostridium sp. BL-8]OOM79957.1 putative glycosyltransferase EpsJ [Clostridium sp. BL-8]